MNLEELETKGLVVSYRYEGRDQNVTKFSSFLLPFTPEQWVNVIKNDGPWLPSCCSNISYAKDILISVLREGGWMRMPDLARVVELTSTHEGFKELYDDLKQRAENLALGDPLALLYDIWDVLKNHPGLEKTGENREHLDLQDPYDAAHVLQHSLFSFRVHLMFTGADAQITEWHKHRQRLAFLKDIVPALNTLCSEIPKLDPGPLEGVAVVSSKTGKVVYSNNSAVILPDKETAEKVLSIWESDNKEFQSESYAIKKVKISVEKGCEVLEDC